MWSLILSVLLGLFVGQAMAQEKQEKKATG